MGTRNVKKAAGDGSFHKAEDNTLENLPKKYFGNLTDKLCKFCTPNDPTAPYFMDMSEFAGQSGHGRIIFATDDYFAAADNLLNDSEPVSIEDKNTKYGKWMDGWETRRKRTAGHDWCIIQLVASCRIRGIMVDTAYFTGNFAPRISVQGGHLTADQTASVPHRNGTIGTSSSKEELQSISQLGTESWPEIIRMSNLRPGTEETRKNYFYVNVDDVFSFIRVNIYPDGGMARLRVFGVGVPDLSAIDGGDSIDLIGMENGGVIVSYSNAYFGHPRNLIKKNRANEAGDGWETTRRLDRPPTLREDSNGSLIVPGSEWTIIKMGYKGIVNEVVIDLKYFHGNAPYSLKIEGTLSNANEALVASTWAIILEKQTLNATDDDDKIIYKSDEIRAAGPFNYVKITIYPDGGFSRLRLVGREAM